ncbi:hypothetical protein ILFOPFJJ_07008 [Ensifer psoraleae]|nr:hypothetical protein [Sinorhizobium psoraleae]
MPPAAAPQPAQSSQLSKRLSKRPLHPEDAPLILGLEEALINAKAAEHTARNNASTLFSFGHWLFANKKDPIKDRLNDESLIDDAREFSGAGDPAGLFTAIGHLRTSQSIGGIVLPQPVRSTEFRRKLLLHPVDAELVLVLEKALINASERTAKGYVRSLLSFAHWLFANNKDPIRDRLNHESLTGDAREFGGAGDPARLSTVLGHRRSSQSTGSVVPIVSRAKLNPYPEDGYLIEEYRNEAAPNTGSRNAHASFLRSFSDYLRQNSKKSIAGRLSGKALDGDVESFKRDAGGNATISAALAHLRKSQAGAKAMERERHIGPVRDPGDAAPMEQMRVVEAATSLKFLRRLSKHPLHPEDAKPILGLGEALIRGKASQGTARNNVNTLLSFGHWLFKSNKDPITSRLDQRSLSDDAREFIGEGDDARLFAAIGHLRTSLSTGGVVPIAGRA